LYATAKQTKQHTNRNETGNILLNYCTLSKDEASAPGPASEVRVILGSNESVTSNNSSAVVMQNKGVIY
jgi:hypothetical protein